MSKRTYDPNLDDVYVNRDGSIRWDGTVIGHVAKLDDPPDPTWAWRAEIGDPRDPFAWPGFRASYARTRKAAIADVLESVEAPE